MTVLPAVPDLPGFADPVRTPVDAVRRLGYLEAFRRVADDLDRHARALLDRHAADTQAAGGTPKWEFPGVGVALRTRPAPRFTVIDEPGWHTYLAGQDPEAVQTVEIATVRDPRAALALARWTADGDVWDLAALISDALSVTATVYVDEGRAAKVAKTFRPAAWDKRTGVLADPRAVTADGEIVDFAAFRLASAPQVRVTPDPELVDRAADQIGERLAGGYQLPADTEPAAA